MNREYIIDACSGKAIDVYEGESITVVDLEGMQVVDFFAENLRNSHEYLSTGVTIDCNESFRLNIDDIIYTNLYNPMLKVIADDVGEHDLIHPCCRTEMYDFFYDNGQGHSNCLDNINNSLKEKRDIITPVNLFMYTKINSDGTISVEKPKSKKGDKIVLQALMDIRIGVAACSVSESMCNGGKTSPIKIIVES